MDKTIIYMFDKWVSVPLRLFQFQSANDTIPNFGIAIARYYCLYVNTGYCLLVTNGLKNVVV